MRKFICRLTKQDPESREGILTSMSILGILFNLMIAGAKVVVGLIASSVAVVAEGANSAADALNSLITLGGASLARKHPDARHPFGYGRVEYLSALIVSFIILFTGGQALLDSVKRIFHPEPLDVSVLTIVILAVSAGAKLAFGLYTIAMGKKADSSVLVGVGKEARNDCFASLFTLVCIVLFAVSGINLDGYAGCVASVLILKAGIELLLETVSELIGRKGEKELADALYREIRSTKGIIGAADMMLHNYGPDAWSGSVNVEIDHKKTTAEVYALLHALQLKIMHEQRVTMVFGVYAVDNDHEYMKKLRSQIASFVRETPHVLSYHAVYLEPETKKLYCDMVVDYELRDWDELRKAFTDYMKSLYPDQRLELTLETEYV